VRKLRALWRRLGGLFANRREDGEFDTELESHVTMHVEDGVRAGMSPEDARREALIRLGGAEQVRQAYREQRTLPWLENLMRDSRYALRGLGRNPVFAITAIATLALGIGATTAVFSVVDRILFRSLPYAHDDRLVSVGLVQTLEKQEFMLGGVLGLAVALVAARLLKSLLFHVGTHDPASFTIVTLLLAVVALAATLIPARAAMKTDPMMALRTE
jgi:hypothetical protein